MALSIADDAGNRTAWDDGDQAWAEFGVASADAPAAKVGLSAVDLLAADASTSCGSCSDTSSELGTNNAARSWPDDISLGEAGGPLSAAWWARESAEGVGVQPSVESFLGLVAWAGTGSRAVTLHQYGLLEGGGCYAPLLGLYHAELEVFGARVTFDAEHGVLLVAHKQRARSSTVVGTVACEPHDVADLLARMARAWPARSYRLLGRNCQHFCSALAEQCCAH